MLGEKILKLRKKQGFSQEQLGEQVHVTRQTISNWELNETTPNPEQLKLLSKALQVSIDELLDNERKEVLMNKVSNTEKLAGMIIKILKVLGIIIILYFVCMVIALICLGIYTIKKQENASSSAVMICTLDKQKYEIEFGTNHYFKCNSCSNSMTKELKSLTDFEQLDESITNIEKYFLNHQGTCDE